MNLNENKFDYLVIDTLNLCHRILDKKDTDIKNLSGKPIYKKFVVKFINLIEDLKSKYLHSDGSIYLLFDNYNSRIELQNAFMYADRKSLDPNYKSTRGKAAKEFYNSVNLIRYYYMIGPKKYFTSRVEGLEADDLVRPLLDKIFTKDSRILFITNDLDWCRYLNNNVYWLPDFSKEPENAQDLSYKLGFHVDELGIVCYKSIFGDASDNIPAVARYTEKNFNKFKELLKKFKDPLDFINYSRNKKGDSTLSESISNNEGQYIINVQLTSPIICRPDIFERELIEGREATRLYKALRQVLGMEESDKSFIFGKVRRPRV